MIKMTLSFVTSHTTVTLNQTVFKHPLLPQDITTVRGAAAPQSVGNFRWSHGVRALSLLLVRQALQRHRDSSQGQLRPEPVCIEGKDSSLAASLDYALSKQPLWIQDMFGKTPQEKSISKLLFRRINPDRKRPGPVTVFIANPSFEVVVQVDGRLVKCARQLRYLAESLERVGCVA